MTLVQNMPCGLGLKKAVFTVFFYLLIKRMQGSLCSFMFFWKERKRMWRSFGLPKSQKTRKKFKNSGKEHCVLFQRLKRMFRPFFEFFQKKLTKTQFFFQKKIVFWQGWAMGICSFKKIATFFKKMLLSFTFFWKEHKVLTFFYILFLKNEAFSAFFNVLYKKKRNILCVLLGFISCKNSTKRTQMNSAFFLKNVKKCGAKPCKIHPQSCFIVVII